MEPAHLDLRLIGEEPGRAQLHFHFHSHSLSTLPLSSTSFVSQEHELMRVTKISRIYKNTSPSEFDKGAATYVQSHATLVSESSIHMCVLQFITTYAREIETSTQMQFKHATYFCLYFLFISLAKEKTRWNVINDLSLIKITLTIFEKKGLMLINITN